MILSNYRFIFVVK